MQAIQRGIVLRSMSLLPSIARLAQNFGFHSIVDRAVVKGVRDYQIYISPHKGFCCAHRKLYGTASCSEFFRQTVQTQGSAAAISVFQERLTACKQAYLTLKAQAQVAPVAEEEPDKKQKKQSQVSKPSSLADDFCLSTACDCGVNSIDFDICAGEPGCNCNGFDLGCGDCG